MKLGIIRHWDEEGFIYAAEKNLDFVEYCVNVGCPADAFVSQTDNIIKWIKQYGVTVGSIGRWGDTRINEDGTVNEAGYKSDLELIEAAAKINCPVYNCGVNYINSKSYEENVEIAIAYLTELVKFGKQKGVKIALYNCGWNSFVIEPKAWGKILPRVNGLGIKFDLSHTVGRGGDYFVELRDYGKYIHHFHVKGILQIEGQVYDNAPPGFDLVPWGAVIDTHYANQYTGGLSLEPYSSKWTGKRGEWGIEFSIKYLRQFLMPNEFDE
jgi:sugar phosphate isomerase/epimerase